MSKPLTPRTHGVLDYAVVAVFALAPTVFGLTGLAATLAYALAGVHLAMTLLTAFPLGVARVIPFPLHGKVELAVGIALPALALALFRDADAPFWFYLAMGMAILLTWTATDYRAA